jgi:hypothetical protein
MNGFVLGLYALYLIVVGFRGNASVLMDEASKDAPAYIPWALAIAALAVMSNYETTQKVVKPFILLLILNFVLINFDNLKGELSKLYAMRNGSE